MYEPHRIVGSIVVIGAVQYVCMYSVQYPDRLGKGDTIDGLGKKNTDACTIQRDNPEVRWARKIQGPRCKLIPVWKSLASGS